MAEMFKFGAELTGEASKHMLSRALKEMSWRAIRGVHTFLNSYNSFHVYKVVIYGYEMLLYAIFDLILISLCRSYT